MIMTTDGKALTELCLENWWWAPSSVDTDLSATNAASPDRQPDMPEAARIIVHQTQAWLAAYFAGEHPTLDSAPPLSAQGTPFQHEVWDLITEIPYGQTVSYGAIAAELAERRGGRRMAAQAVGGAVKRNPITIIVPCHRVVGSGRSFGGYGGHLDVKAELLDLEGVDLSRFDLPH
nr:methylated-DNA--[protein]-cysteine S-methyltransferase [Bifidobacterium sp. DSM 109959]